MLPSIQMYENGDPEMEKIKILHLDEYCWNRRQHGNTAYLEEQLIKMPRDATIPRVR